MERKMKLIIPILGAHVETPQGKETDENSRISFKLSDSGQSIYLKNKNRYALLINQMYLDAGEKKYKKVG